MFAFMSHGSPDKPLVQKIGADLLAVGIDVFLDEWDIRLGDSIRRAIDGGLSDCTHFLVLITKSSIDRPWVNEEIDAAFMKKIEGECRFIVLLEGVDPKTLPPLLRGMRAPATCLACCRRMAMWNQSRNGRVVTPASARMERSPEQPSVNAVSSVSSV